MARIFRFRLEMAAQIMLAEAQAQGLPVQMQQVQQGLIQVIKGLYTKGIGLSIDESSPAFAQFAQPHAGQAQQVRAPVPQQMPMQMPMQPQAPVYAPAPTWIPPTQAPAPVPGFNPVPQAIQATPQGAPPIPPYFPQQNPGLRSGPVEAVPLSAPMADAPLSMTEMQPPVPQI